LLKVALNTIILISFNNISNHLDQIY